MPLYLGDHSPGQVPALGLVSEVMVGDNRPPGRPLGRPCQQVGYFPTQHFVGWQPDGVADLSGLQIFVKFRLGEGDICSEQQPQPLLPVSFHHRLKEFLPALGAMDVAGGWVSAESA
jgi:hypothetical protein